MKGDTFFRSKRTSIKRRSMKLPRGFTLIESTVAVLLLMVAMTATLQAVSWIARERRSLDRREVAIREVEHVLDLLTGADFALDQPPSLSPEGHRALLDGTISVDQIDEEVDGFLMTRMTVTLHYLDRPGISAAPVRLSTWVAPRSNPSGLDLGANE